MIKNQVCITSWMAGKTSGAIVHIAAHPCMLFIRLWIRMAGNTGKFCIVGGV
jgi:hypothetical protein